MLINSVTSLCYVSCMKVYEYCCILAVLSHEPNIQIHIQISCWGLAPVPLLEMPGFNHKIQILLILGYTVTKRVYVTICNLEIPSRKITCPHHACFLTCRKGVMMASCL